MNQSPGRGWIDLISDRSRLTLYSILFARAASLSGFDSSISRCSVGVGIHSSVHSPLTCGFAGFTVVDVVDLLSYAQHVSLHLLARKPEECNQVSDKKDRKGKAKGKGQKEDDDR